MKSQAIGFLGTLTLIFIGLKLAEVGVVASWPWWWVLAPLWAPLAMVMVLILVFGLGGAAVRVWRQR